LRTVVVQWLDRRSPRAALSLIVHGFRSPFGYDAYSRERLDRLALAEFDRVCEGER